MSTPVFSIPEFATGVLTFAQYNINQRILEALASNSVTGSVTTPPSNNDGERWRVIAPATGVFTGQENNIAVNVQGAYYFAVPVALTEGFEIFDYGVGGKLKWNGTAWENVFPYPVTEQTATYNANVGDFVPMDSTLGALTVNPPATPVAGDTFGVVDSRGQAATFNITVDFITAGQPFHGAAANQVLTVANDSFTFRYIGATVGWVLI